MRLIDEIEAGEDLHDLWPRIRAALLAGEEMATFCENAVPTSYAGEAAIRFRAATEGTK